MERSKGTQIPEYGWQGDSSFSQEHFNLAYPQGIEQHFWNHSRHKIILRKLLPFLSKQELILDIGCGTGITVGFLREAGLCCYGCDIAAVQPYSDSIVPFFYPQTDVFRITGDLQEECKIVLLLDILEHLKTPNNFIDKCTRHFPNLKYLLITLPARKELWSNYDEHYQHVTRYDLQNANDLLKNTRCSILQAGYFFHSLYIPLRLITLTGKLRNPKWHSPKLLFFHHIASVFLSLEERLVPSRIPGTSLYLILKVSYNTGT